MNLYTFKFGPFYFKVHGIDAKDAVSKARRAIEESMPEDTTHYLNIELTAGGHCGRLYVEPAEVSIRHIVKEETLEEQPADAPF